MNSQSPTLRNTRPNGPSGGNNSSRNMRRNSSSRHRRRSGTNWLVPPTFLSRSFDEKKTHRNSSDCIEDAIAVLRSTKRRKHCGDEPLQQQQRQDEDGNDTRNKLQTPSTADSSSTSTSGDTSSSSASDNPSRPVNASSETKHRVVVSSSGVLERPNTSSIPRTKGWEWSIGVLPPAPADQERQPSQQQHQYYSRTITPLLYSSNGRLPGGRSGSTNFSFLPGITTATDCERQQEGRRISSIHHHLGNSATTTTKH